MSDEEIAALGGPAAAGIPSASIGSGLAAPPPVPLISVSLEGDALTLSWPASATGFVLETTSALGDEAEWTPVPGADAATVTITISRDPEEPDRGQFFRLRRIAP